MSVGNVGQNLIDYTQYTKMGNSASQVGSTDDASTLFSSGAVDSVELSSTEETKESDKIKEELEELQAEKEENLEKMEKLEAEIEKLAEEAEAQIKKAAEAQEEAVKDHKEAVDKAVKEQINAYIEANKNGDGMTRDQLQANIGEAVKGLPMNVQDAVNAAVKANDLLNDIDGLNGELRSLISDTQNLEVEIDAKQGEYDAAVQAETCPPPTPSCDPIGFAMTDENGEQVKYDFIVDDGKFDSTSDFLGADNQWEAMQALDTDGDNIVTSDELAAGNIKAVKTNADGSQDVVSLADEFGADFSVDLNSYKEGGSYAGIGSSDADGDGVLDQELLGTFNLNINGQSVEGYNTLDDVDWLSDNYNISNDASVQNAENQDSLDASQFSEDLQPHVEFLNTYTQKVAELREELAQVYETLGISKEDMANYNEVASLEADQKATEFMASLESDETDETDEAEKSPETDEANQANAAQANASESDSDSDEEKEEIEEKLEESKAA